MIGARPRYGRIEQLTDTLLVQAGVSAPEVPVDRIITARGITIEPSASLAIIRRFRQVVFLLLPVALFSAGGRKSSSA